MSDRIDNGGADLPTGSPRPRWIISIDYGTTFTGAAWALTRDLVSGLPEINVVKGWPGSLDRKVPSQYTYSGNGGELGSFDTRNSQHIIRKTKLDLEPPTLDKALLNLCQTLMEPNDMRVVNNVVAKEIPKHLTKTPADVLTRYLEGIVDYVRRDIENQRDPEALVQFPIDIIITHPAVWAQEAKNHTFRAVINAFQRRFPENMKWGNIRLATEPEACAQYTMKAEEGWAHLRKGDCFIVVDAGGGTVDLVSYQVDQVAPNFRVTRITEPTCGRFGATSVEDYFLTKFLPARLATEDYMTLKNFGLRGAAANRGAHNVLSPGEEMMLRQFMTLKHNFTGPPERGEDEIPSSIEPPDRMGLRMQDSDRRNIKDGQLIITSRDMMDMFEDSVSGTLGLIRQQIRQVEDELRLQVTAVFLSGGFAESKYLQKRVLESIRGEDIALHCGSECLTAVANGAILMGLGINCDIPPPCIPCPLHIGVVVAQPFRPYAHDESQGYTDSFDRVSRARDNVRWLFRRGDLITSQTSETSETMQRIKIIRKIRGDAHGSRGNMSGTVYIHTSTVPWALGPSEKRMDIRDNSRVEVALGYDLATLAGLEAPPFKSVIDPQTRQTYLKVEMELVVRLFPNGAEVSLTYGRVVNYLGTEQSPGYLLAAQQIPFPLDD